MVRLYDTGIQTITIQRKPLVSLLRKVIFEDYSYLTNQDVEKLLDSKELTRFQKISLKYAFQEHTPTHKYVISLNKPAKLTNVQKLMEKYKHG
ncbi:Uncharacterised protein [Streptococcus pneumoniae]|nr:putative uncharacterized protein [Streptococcus pneumoniae]CVM18574.1 Uncharacterised protein [Streptococcus pneumoniae]CVR37844.1 Uncharacterised protein [Streptococcus pneumoniae]CVS99276.1 Uncharacterised protein [Streptococcus pneumoniae]CWA17983.1 Uncharacterised protein [Streptococcus pneumoniae]